MSQMATTENNKQDEISFTDRLRFIPLTYHIHPAVDLLKSGELTCPFYEIEDIDVLPGAPKTYRDVLRILNELRSWSWFLK